MPDTNNEVDVIGIRDGLMYEDVYSLYNVARLQRMRLKESYPNHPDEIYQIRQKQLVDSLVTNVQKMAEVRHQNLIERIDKQIEALRHPEQIPEEKRKKQEGKIKGNIEMLQFYKQKLEKQELPTMKGKITVLSDTHGDALSLLGSIIDSGAVTVVEGEYVYFDLTNGEIYGDIQDIPDYSDPEKQKNILMLPKLVPNENYQGEIIHLGDYIDRDPENKLSLGIVYYLKTLLKDKFHALPGNHEISCNGDDGAKRCHDILKLFFDRNFFEPSVMIGDTCFSHCQLTKDMLPMLFRYASSFVGNEHEAQNINDETKKFGEAFLQILEEEKYSTLKQKLTSFHNAEQSEFTSNPILKRKNLYEQKFNYDYLIGEPAKFTEFEMFQLRDVFIKTQIEMYKDISNINIEAKVQVPPFPNLFGLSPAGPEFIASRRQITDDNKFSIKQVVGHTYKDIAEMIQNIFFLDTKRHSLYPMVDEHFNELHFESIISNFVFNRDGNLLCNDAFSAARGENNFISKKPNIEQLYKNYRGDKYRKNGSGKNFYDKKTKSYYTSTERNLTSLNKTLSAMWDYEDEINRNKKELVAGVVSIVAGILISIAVALIAITISPLALCGAVAGIGLLIYGSIKTHKTLNDKNETNKKQTTKTKTAPENSLSKTEPNKDEQSIFTPLDQPQNQNGETLTNLEPDAPINFR